MSSAARYVGSSHDNSSTSTAWMVFFTRHVADEGRWKQVSWWWATVSCSFWIASSGRSSGWPFWSKSSTHFNALPSLYLSDHIMDHSILTSPSQHVRDQTTVVGTCLASRLNLALHPGQRNSDQLRTACPASTSVPAILRVCWRIWR